MITWFSSHLLSDRTDTVSGNRPLSPRKHKMTSPRFKISTHLCRLHIYNPSLYAGKYLHNTTAVLSIFHKLLQLRFARSSTSCQPIWNQTVLDLQRKSITWQRPPVSSFLLSWQRQPSPLISCPLVIACRTLVSKNESIWRVIFTCNEPENHHARKPNYECLILWQPNKYFTL